MQFCGLKSKNFIFILLKLVEITFCLFYNNLRKEEWLYFDVQFCATPQKFCRVNQKALYDELSELVYFI